MNDSLTPAGAESGVGGHLDGVFEPSDCWARETANGAGKGAAKRMSNTVLLIQDYCLGSAVCVENLR